MMLTNCSSKPYCILTKQFGLNSILSIPNISIPIPFFTYSFLPWIGTPSAYLEYILQVVYILSISVRVEIILN